MTENKIIHQCSKCTKTYKSSKSLKKHEDKCCLEKKIKETEKQFQKKVKKLVLKKIIMM